MVLWYHNTNLLTPSQGRMAPSRAPMPKYCTHTRAGPRFAYPAGTIDQSSLGRRSRTRTALPMERGISPGSFTATSAVTPMMDLM